MTERNMAGFDLHFNNVVARISGKKNQYTHKCDFSHFEKKNWENKT